MRIPLQRINEVNDNYTLIAQLNLSDFKEVKWH